MDSSYLDPVRQAEDLIKSLELTSPDITAKTAEIVSTIARITAASTQAMMLGKLAGRIDVPVRSLRQDLEVARAKAKSAKLAVDEQQRRVRLASASVDPAALLKQLRQFFRQHAYLPEGADLVLALFALNTWAFGRFGVTPYLSVESATRGCGKTTVLELLETVCARPRRVTDVSEAVLYRLIEGEKPTLLIDEAELTRGRGDRASAIRAIAHAGYKKGGGVPRCVGNEFEPQIFDVYCPKVFATIGSLTGPLMDRCIVIRLEKAPPQQLLTPIRHNRMAQFASVTRFQIEAYVEQHGDALVGGYEAEPPAGYWPFLWNREAEIWTPLLLHARRIGIEEEAIEVARRFSRRKQDIQRDEADVQLCRGLLAVLELFGDAAFSPSELIDLLKGHDAWATVLDNLSGRGAAMKVSEYLKRFDVSKVSHHRNRGSLYATEEAVRKLRVHVPDANEFGLVAHCPNTNDCAQTIPLHPIV